MKPESPLAVQYMIISQESDCEHLQRHIVVSNKEKQNQATLCIQTLVFDFFYLKTFSQSSKHDVIATKNGKTKNQKIVDIITQKLYHTYGHRHMASTGIEPATFALLARRSNQLS